MPHTPGPWHRVNLRIFAGPFPDQMIPTSLLIATCSDAPTKADGNAALIAAAPAMADVLLGILRSAGFESGQAEPRLTELNVGIPHLEGARRVLKAAGLL